MTRKLIGSNLGGLLAVIGLLAGWYWQSTGARAVPALTRSLGDERARVRVVAASALAEIGPEARPAVPALLDLALHDPDPNASTTAAGALKTIDLSAARRVMTAYLPQLQSDDARTRRKACDVLASLGPVARPAVPRLGDALDDADAGVRNRAVSALGSIALPAAQVVPALVRALRDPSAAVRYRAVLQFSFGQTPDAAVPVLEQLRGDEEKSVANLAEVALAGARREQMSNVPVLVLMLQTSSAHEYTLLQLAKLGPRAAEAVPALIPVLSDPRAFDRYLAVEALGAIGPQAAAALPALASAREDADPVVRESAARAVEAIAGPRFRKRETSAR